MPLGYAEKIGADFRPNSTNRVADDAILFDEQLPAVFRAGDKPHARMVASHVCVREREHVIGKGGSLLLVK